MKKEFLDIADKRDVPKQDQDSEGRISSIEKDELMDFAKKQEGLSIFHLFISACIIFLILSVFIPKIYLSSNVYYISRDISRLYGEKELLHEERIRLQREIERINERHLWLELGE